MRLFNKVAIVGVGLIGGSLALAIKEKRLAGEVVGVSRHTKTLLLAKRKRAIDKGSQDLNIIKDADLIILATPVSTILSLAPKVSKVIKKGCVVTDVGSTKQEIVAKLGKVFARYIGSHPLAGSEKRSVVNADSRLFNNSLCILTPIKNTDRQTLAKIKRLWSNLGAKTVSLTPQRHDKILSFVSHLPHIAAFSLINAVPRCYLKFASTGLKDTTRIAASDSELWSEIFLGNRKNIVKTIELFQESLATIKSAIKSKNGKALAGILKEAKKKREFLN